MIKKVFVSLCMGCALFGLVASTPSATAEVLVSQPQTVSGAELYAFGQKFSSSIFSNSIEIYPLGIENRGLQSILLPFYGINTEFFEPLYISVNVFNTSSLLPSYVIDQKDIDEGDNFMKALEELLKKEGTVTIEDGSPLLIPFLGSLNNVSSAQVSKSGDRSTLQFIASTFSLQDFSRGDLWHYTIVYDSTTHVLVVVSWYLESASSDYNSAYAKYLDEKGYVIQANDTYLQLQKKIPTRQVVQEYIAKLLLSNSTIKMNAEHIREFFSQSTPISSFPDVQMTDWYYPDIHYVKEHAIMMGYPDGTFRGGNTINRAEFVKTLFAQDTVATASCYTEKQQKGWSYMYFKDVPMDAWYAPYICVAKENAVISGYADGLFHPEQSITKAESMKIVVEHFMPKPINLENQDPNAPWYTKYYAPAGVLRFFDHNTYPEDSSMREALVRDQMAGILRRAHAFVALYQAIL